MRELKFRRWNDVDKKFEWFWLASHSILTTLKIPSKGTWDTLECWQQYVGLEDMIGNEIYEGDIVTITWCGDNILCQVIYEDASFYLWDVNSESSTIGKVRYLFGDINTGEDIYVMGNIYENPDLL